MDFRFFLAVPVWGHTYVDTFLNASLPTLMAPGNLPYLSTACKVKFTIYTSKQDAEIIQQNKLIQQLANTTNTELAIEILEIPDRNNYTNKHDFGRALYELKSFTYKNNFDHAAKFSETGVAISLNADIIFSADFMRHAYGILLSGKKVIEVSGPRGKATEIRNIIESKRGSSGEIAIGATELLEIWIDNFHELIKLHFWEDADGDFNCSHILWPIRGAKGWLARCFYLYPIVVVIPKGGVDFSGTIDLDLVTNCGYSYDEVEVLTNHSQMFCCELSEEGKFVGAQGIRGNLPDLAAMFKQHGDAYNLFLQKHYISLAVGYNHMQWHLAAIKSNTVIDGVTEIMFAPADKAAEKKRPTGPIDRLRYMLKEAVEG